MDSSIHVAAKCGCVEEVRSFIERGVSVDACDGNKWTPLHWASHCGQMEVAQFLVEQKCDLEMETNQGDSPLLRAAWKGRKDIVDFLILSGANVHCCNRNRRSLLHYASRNEWMDVVKVCIDKKYDLDYRDIHGVTPLLLAADEENKDAVYFLIESGAAVECCNNNGRSLLHYASRNEWMDVMKLCIDNKCDLDPKDIHGDTPLLLAADKVSKEVVDLLIRSGADVLCGYKNGRKLLHYASRNEWIDVVKVCIDNKCDLNHQDNNGETPLHLAADTRNKDVVDLLIRSGADVHCCCRAGWSLLHYASWNGWMDIVEVCIDNKCDLNYKVDNGNTPLLLAASEGNRDITDLLIRSGADLHGCGGPEWTLLHYACVSGWLDVAKRCVEEGFDLDCEDLWGKTPLHHAWDWENMEIAKYLLESGANCNLQNYCKETAFFHAVKTMPNVEVVALFLNHGFYFEQADYLSVFDNDSLKKVFKNSLFCSQAIVNKFNNKYLPEFYDRCGSSDKLPTVGLLKVKYSQNVAHEVKKCVEWEIQSKTHCDVMRFNPIVLKMLCVRSLISNN